MSDHKVFRDSNGDFLIRASGTNNFFVHTTDDNVSTVPGPVASFTISSDTTNPCNSTNAINFDWTPPSDNGGSPITGYLIRRIFAYWQVDGIRGDVNLIPTYFDNQCEATLPRQANPLPVANITSTTINNWKCDFYSFQIAAVNANGVGPYYPTGADLDDHYSVIGDDGLGISVDGNIITVTYTSSSDGCSASQTNYQNTAATLYRYEASANYWISEDFYTGYSPGTATLTAPSPGYYYVTVEESWTDYSTTCTVEKDGCLLRIPFEVV